MADTYPLDSTASTSSSSPSSSSSIPSSQLPDGDNKKKQQEEKKKKAKETGRVPISSSEIGAAKAARFDPLKTGGHSLEASKILLVANFHVGTDYCDPVTKLFAVGSKLLKTKRPMLNNLDLESILIGGSKGHLDDPGVMKFFRDFGEYLQNSVCQSQKHQHSGS
jgi:hypothetical protein